MKRKCPGPGVNGSCGREITALGLCQTHYRQQYRGLPLTPIRDKSASKDTREITGCRVKKSTYLALEREADRLDISLYMLMRRIVEEYVDGPLLFTEGRGYHR